MSEESHSSPSGEGGVGGTTTEILQYYFLNLTFSKPGGAVVGDSAAAEGPSIIENFSVIVGNIVVEAFILVDVVL